VVDVLVSPTDDGVLNQIPVGDGRESSREQAVLADGAPCFLRCSLGAGRPSPPWRHHLGVWWQSGLPDPQKKKKKSGKKWNQPWLLSVLTAFGLPGELLRLIGDLILDCRSRVRINSGYSPYFMLKRGVRQGDPLSCLLFNFSIEPLAIRL